MSDGTNSDTPKGAPETCDPRVLELLVCPITKGTLVFDAVRQELVSKTARLAYPIRRGVPHLVPSEARHLDDPEPSVGPRP